MSESLDCIAITVGLLSVTIMPLFMIVALVQLSGIRQRLNAVENSLDTVERMVRAIKERPQRPLPRAPVAALEPHRPPESPARPPIAPRPAPPVGPTSPQPAPPDTKAPPTPPPATSEASTAAPPEALEASPAASPPQTPAEEPPRPTTPPTEPEGEALISDDEAPGGDEDEAPVGGERGATAPTATPTPEAVKPATAEPRQAPSPEQPRPQPAQPPQAPARARRGESSMLERGIGGTAAVWGGAGALALAGALLVQYSIEQDLISAEARVGVAVAAALVLLGIGEWLVHRIRLVGGGLLAAGVAVLYSSFMAATVLYPILNPWVGAGLMFLTTATAATMAIRHKLLIIAVLGLLGGFITPMVTGSQSGNPILFFGYLLLLNAGVIIVAWKRSWPVLTYMALLLSFIAELGWMSRDTDALTAPYLIMIVLMAGPFALASHFGVGLTRTPRDDEEGAPEQHNPWSWIVMSASLMMPIFIGLIAGVRWVHTPYLWIQQGLLAVLVLVMAGIHDRYRPLPVIAWLLLIAQQAAWLFDEPSGERFALIAGLTAVVFGVGFSVLTLRRVQRLGEPMGLLVVLTGQTALAFSYSPTRALLDHWSVIMLAIAAWLIAMIWAVHQRRDRSEGAAIPSAISPLSVTASAFIALAIALELEFQWMTLAWIIQALCMLAVGLRFKATPLVFVSILLSFMAAARLIPLPWLLDDLSGGHPIINPILYVYGLAAAACFLASHLYARRDDIRLSPMVLGYGLSGLALVLLGVTLLVRHAFHSDFSGTFTGPEHLTYSLSWAGVGVATLVVGLIRRSSVARVMSLLLIMGTSLKVFLFDLSYLTGLGRVASVAGLGAVMIVIAILYRVYVFPSDEGEPSDDEGAPPDQDHLTARPSPEAAPANEAPTTEEAQGGEPPTQESEDDAPRSSTAEEQPIVTDHEDAEPEREDDTDGEGGEEDDPERSS
ncbi:MAG: hypothetical protein CMH57_01615 [Myxococcales bacterium]|nr:hypothetical protein [Myxococcales bacterium]